MSAANLDYGRDGLCWLRRLVAGERLQAMRADLDAALPDVRADGPHGILRHDVWRRLPAFAATLAAGEVARRLCALTGLPRLRLFQDNLVWKTAGARSAIAWHQDYAYWPLDSPAGVTLWLALDDADAENGCLHYVSGSHVEGERAAPDFLERGLPGIPEARGAKRSRGLPSIDLAGREADVVAMPVRAGDAIAHHPLVWHMSPPNRSARPRRAWSVSFVTPGTRWCPGHAPHPFNHQLSPRDGAPLSDDRFPLFGM